MQIEYKLTENDFLTYQLFVASKSKTIRKIRRYNKFELILVIVMMEVILILFGKYEEAIYALMPALVVYFLSTPIWQQSYISKQYKSFLKENYAAGFDKISIVEFNDDNITVKNTNNGSVTNITEINEIKTLIIIKFKTAQSLIISKDEITELDNLKIKLKEISTRLNIAYNIDENWKWK
ncbi:MAG: hypothetical protein LBT56_07350 [Prevotellaceae bacterium]|jgi:hypothetical protein|nr:hypothetical protein [Prevotellaceae bacterium]